MSGGLGLKLERLEGLIHGLVRMQQSAPQDELNNTRDSSEDNEPSAVEAELGDSPGSRQSGSAALTPSGHSFVSRAGETLWSSLLSEVSNIMTERLLHLITEIAFS